MREWDGVTPIGGLSVEQIDEICARVSEALEPDGIAIFGSRARGAQQSDSDIDLIVFRDFACPSDRIRMSARVLKSLRGFGYPFDVLITSPVKEAEALRDRGQVYKGADDEGVMIYAA